MPMNVEGESKIDTDQFEENKMNVNADKFHETKFRYV